MASRSAQSLGGIAAALAVGAAVAWAGSDGSTRVGGWPLFALCGALAYAIQWVAFVPSYLAQTEHYYDLTGSLTYLTLVATSLVLAPAPDARAVLVAVLVATWALRLGSFLFRRIRRDGSDGRFDRIKPDPLRFGMAWTLQGLWVFLTLAAGLAVLTSEQPRPLGAFALLGALVWAAGFAVEVTADRQKAAFRSDPANDGRFIDAGLWAWSRHPNYFGEIVLWCGVAIVALPVLEGWRWVVLVSPLFVYVLLSRISGVPLLEARSERRWGDDPAYRAYAEQTPVLWPRPPRRA